GAIRGLFTNVAGRAKGALGVLFLDTEDVMSPALLLHEWADKTPGAVFLRFEGDELTYREMRELVRGRAATLKRVGVRWGDLAALVRRDARRRRPAREGGRVAPPRSPRGRSLRRAGAGGRRVRRADLRHDPSGAHARRRALRVHLHLGHDGSPEGRQDHQRA